jgi:hypothetical protein
MTADFNVAAGWLKQNISVSYDADAKIFSQDNYKMRLAKILYPSIQDEMVQEIAKIALSAGNEFSEQVLSSYGKKYATHLEKLDRDIHPNRQYKIAKNVDDFSRWKRWGFDPTLFSEHYDFARFLLDTPLGSQMKLFAHRDPIKMVKGEPAILVDGVLTRFSVFSKIFVVDTYGGEKMLVRKDESMKSGLVYTFLGNGMGLQRHHPYHADRPIVVDKLTKDEFKSTMDIAQHFYEDPEFSRNFPHVLQIVSSELEGKDTNFSNLLLKPKHPWVRIIIGTDRNGFEKGDVFDGGFGWVKKSTLPGIASTGRFRCLDVWNYQSAKNRVVTNIPISDETLEALKKEILTHQLESIELGREMGFNLFRHNCTSFIDRVGNIVPGLEMEARVELKELLYRVSPNWMQSIGNTVVTAYEKLKDIGRKISNSLPKCIGAPARAVTHVVRRVFDFLVALPLNIFTYLTGGMLGQKKRGFEAPVEPQGVRTSLKDFYYFIPGVLQNWQKRQKSTVIFAKPTTLAVAKQ